MKKIFLILSTVFVMSLSACGTTGDNSTPSRAKTYTVTFNSNGGSQVESQTVEEGKKITKPTEPTKDGYNFVNWTYMGEEWSFIGYVVTEDMTLTANWATITYNITYELDGGTLPEGVENPSTYTVEDSFTLNNPTKIEHMFTGWTFNGGTITQITAGTTGDMTLVANWSINSHDVTVTSSDTSRGTVTGSGTYEYNSQVTVEAKPKNNCFFKGWYNVNNVKVSDKASYTFTMPANNVVLSALFWGQEEEWGVIPTIDGKKINYGLYPQSNVNDTDLINELNKLTTPESNGWYLYNNEYYAKATAYPFDSSYTFDNGTTIIRDTTYWFKCETIKWDILSSNNGEYYLLSSVLLNIHVYYNSQSDRIIDDKIIYANNYKHSDIRAWLNNDFYNSAFALGNTHIKTTTVDNSAATTDSSDNSYACENTEDKIFLLSYQDYQTLFSDDNARLCKTTDYTRAKGAHCEGVNGSYWTRSPGSPYPNSAWCIKPHEFFNLFVDFTTFCVRPSINLKIA